MTLSTRPVIAQRFVVALTLVLISLMVGFTLNLENRTSANGFKDTADKKAALNIVDKLKPSPSENTIAKGHAAFANLPIRFEPNQGQVDAQVKFQARGAGYGFFLTSSETVIALTRHAGGKNSLGEPVQTKTKTAVIRLGFVGANLTPRTTGEEELPSKSFYFIGNDPAKWRKNVSNYARVRQQEIYPGIDLVHYGTQGKLEYDFEVKPGADPRKIQLSFAGARKIRIDEHGDLILVTSAGEFRQQKPIIYQEVDGEKRLIAGRYVLKGKNLVSFQVGEYDRTKILIIDPALFYSSYLGGSGDDQGNAIALNSTGDDVYVAGWTSSTNLPFKLNPYNVLKGPSDAFVARINVASGYPNLYYTAYFGGAGSDQARGIAVNSGGYVYLTGETNSSDFPTSSAQQPSLAGFNDAFVTRFFDSYPFGGISLSYSTYLGGSTGADTGYSIAADSSGNAFVTGGTGSTDFPTTNPIQISNHGSRDVFVTKINSFGQRVYSTYLGGSGFDNGTSIVCDSSGNSYLTGYTFSSDFPTANALQTGGFGGIQDAFVAKVNAAGSALVYSTYLGGGSNDSGVGIQVDLASNVYVTGNTFSANFPTANARQPNSGGSADAFVTKLNSAGSGLTYSTYHGGSGNDFAGGIGLDSSGNAYIVGSTASANFPTVSPYQPSSAGGTDTFVSELDPSGSALLFSTYFGGADEDDGYGIAVSASGNAHITGVTYSSNLPRVREFQFGPSGASEAFVAAFYAPVTLTVKSVNPNSSVIVTVSPNDNNGQGDGSTQFTRTYDAYSYVTLAAPQTAAGNNFLKWQRDGSDYSTSAESSVSLNVSRTMTAVYVTPPANDNFANAQVISNESGTVTGNNQGATKEPNEPNFAGTGNAGGASVWYQWQAPADGNYTFTTYNSDFNTMLVIYTGSSVDSLTDQGHSDDDPQSFCQTNVSRVGFTAVQGQIYYISVDGFSGASGNIFLRWGKSATISGQANGSADRINLTGNICLRTGGGSYSLTNVPTGGSYNIGASDSSNPAAAFGPYGTSAANLNPLTDNVSGINFVQQTPVYAAAGTVKTGAGDPIAASVTCTNTQPSYPDSPRSTDTTSGNWSISGLWQSSSYQCVPANSSYAFTPSSVTVSFNNFGIQFVGALVRTLTVASTNPANGVSITVSPNDRGGLGDGSTQFTRTYNDAQAVSVTAPATASSNNFQKWLKDGVDFANNTQANVNVTMDADHTMTAVYVTPASTGPLTLVVNTLGDAADANVGDGICDSDAATAGDQCTLRAALQETNSATTGVDDINFSLPPGSTITLNDLLPDLTGSLNINGPGASTLTIERSSAVGTPFLRIFSVAAGATANISGLTIARGKVGNSGGGILNQGTLDLSNSIITENSGFAGGGIRNENGGILTISSCTITGNFTRDLAGSGGGISIFGGTVTITDTIISNNDADMNGGGGVYNNATLILIRSTLTGNATTFTGAGILNESAGASATVINSTISGNQGGGCTGWGGTFTLENTTVTNNGGMGAVNIDGYGGVFNLANTIVAGNTGTGSSQDVSGAFTSQGYNLIGKSDGSSGLTHGVNGDQVGTSANPINPFLGPLANNGGPTLTHALLSGSPALDAGSNAVSDGAGLTTDQRGTGFVRKSDSADADTTQTVDIGAFEAHVSVEDITDKFTAEDTPTSFGFNVGDASLITNVTASSSNTTLVPNLPSNINITGSGATRILNLTPAADQFGTSTITVTVTSGSESMSDTFVLTVTPLADTPSVTNATTNEDTQTTTGLVISRNAADGGEVTHFKISGITNGTLFKNNGSTQINNGDFITFADGNAGLRFTPAANLFSPTTTPFSFDVQGATDGSGSGLSSAVTATITVDPVADIPSVTNATTVINTQTSSGLVISRNIADSTEVTHFKITNITNGLLFKNDGTTLITNNTFITFAEGSAGLKFTPFSNLTSPSSTFSFQVQGATSASGAGLSPAATATITVTCGGESVVTNTNDSGSGSLRNAIITACPGETITFAAALTSGGPATVTLTSADLTINKNLTIEGPGANLLTVQRSTAAGTPIFRVFTTTQTLTANISGMTISNGRTTNGTDGGAIFNQNNATLTLTNVTLSGNATGDASSFRAGFGGGIYNRGTINLINSTVSGNVTGKGAFAGSGRGGSGGGIYNNSGAVLKLVNSTVSGNATGNGVTNFADGDGGGIYNAGTATVTNSTISNNTTSTGDSSTAGGQGAGIKNAIGGTLTLRNCTIAGNVASRGFGGSSGGGISGGGTLGNTIIANNLATNSPDLDGGNSLDYNLIGNTSGASFTGTTTHHITNVNPLLGPLADNGGPTFTHALLSGSPAIDAGNNSAITNPPFTGPPFTDQRGGSFNRIASGGCNSTAIVDIGAFELQSSLIICNVTPQAGRTTGGQQVLLTGGFANLSTVTIGGASASWFYTNGAGDTSAITVTTPAHAAGAVQIDLTPISGSPYTKTNAFAYLPTVFTDDTLVVGTTTVKAQHIIELRQAVDAMRAVAGLAPAPWTDATLNPGSSLIKAIHIQELRTYLDDAATRLGYSTSSYTDPGVASGFVIKRIHIEELRQRIRTIAG